ncbi:glycerophosphodiester phosphodiesterase [Deinococcus sp.]|uniref:glycerophosphodiester phosphodiesterase n=1 Tax=Deinococcus sp. TaxID=47478 RepID=UPI003C7D47DC
MSFQARTQAPFLLERQRAGVLRTAHGGASRAAPDNTLEAIAAALHTQLDFVELDVHLTRDGELLLWHDPQLVTPDGLFEIAGHTLAELRALPLIGGTLATLPQATELLRGHCGVMIDLKAPALERPIAQALRASDFWDVVVCGGYLETLARLKAELPQLGVSLTPNLPFYREPAAHLPQLPFLDALTVYWRAVGPALMRAAQQHGVLVLAWTVDHPPAAAHLLAQGVHGLTSNNLALLEGVRRGG